MLTLYAFFACILLVTAGLVTITVRALWRRSRIGACFAGLAILTSAILLFPLPMHGTFTVLGEVLLSELLQKRERFVDTLEEKRDEDFAAILERRFYGRLELGPRIRLDGSWERGEIGNGLPAYLHRDSGLIWSDLLLWPDAPSSPGLADADRFCEALDPAGYWALPTEGELYHFWAAKGYRHSPGAGHRSLAMMVNTELRLTMPSRYAGLRKEYALRCVALGADAPRSGYSQRDIPLDDWNRFQLAKNVLYLTRRP